MKMRIELEWLKAYLSSKNDVAGYRLGVTIGSNDKVIATFPNRASSAVVYMHIEANVLHQFWVMAFDKAGNLGDKEYVKNAIAPSTI